MKKSVGIILSIALITCGTLCLAKKSENSGSTVSKTITGQCHCGDIKYQAQNTVIKCSYCKCRGCQRSSGALSVPFVSVPKKDVTIKSGKPSEFRATCGKDCDANGVWIFCSKCGSPLFWKADKGNQIDIFAGSLDDTSIFAAK